MICSFNFTQNGIPYGEDFSENGVHISLRVNPKIHTLAMIEEAKKELYRDRDVCSFRVKQQRFIILNETDNVFASPMEMTEPEADKFIQDFPERFKAQGYYRTSTGEQIDPKNVSLQKVMV